MLYSSEIKELKLINRINRLGDSSTETTSGLHLESKGGFQFKEDFLFYLEKSLNLHV